jgi:hypothetical protein
MRVVVVLNNNTIKDILKTSISIFRLLMNIHLKSSFPLMQARTSDICILGNGPSLSISLEEEGNFISAREIMSVNDFAFSNQYDLLQPAYYMLLDPDYWRNDSLPRLKSNREKLFQLINSKTTWRMLLLLPCKARNALNWHDIFQHNRNINICFFNSTPLYGLKYLMNTLYSRNLGMPPAQNVLVAAIFVAINMGYKKIYLFGADHSWHEELILNDDNVVCLKDKHFYDDRESRIKPWQKGDRSGTTFKMHEIFDALSRMFEGYQYLAAYANVKKCKIFNASKRTYIDAFEKYDPHRK